MSQHPDFSRTQPSLKQGHVSSSPWPTRLVSNEEFLPLDQTRSQAHVEQVIDQLSERYSRSLALSRRDFLKTSGGMAVALLAMNQVFGKFFDVLAVEAADPAAFVERRGNSPFIFDVQTHYVSSQFEGSRTKKGLLGLRQLARDLGWNPDLKHDTGTLEDLNWQNFVKEVFLDSDTSIGLISTPPGPYPWESVVPPREMTHIRDELNRITQSQRMLAHGLVMPQLGQRDRDFMEEQAERFRVDAWKCYTGAPPQGVPHGWWMDDEKIAYPMLEKARKLKVPRICVHKGLPLGPVSEYNHPKDLLRAAKDFPDLNFLVYHSGFLGMGPAERMFRETGDIPWTSEFCQMKLGEPEIQNIYMELGSTFAQLVSTNPEMCAHVLGQVLRTFGADHVLWGTDSIWYGTPQWQIEAFRRFEIPSSLQDRFRYSPLTKDVKEKILGLNAARVFQVDVQARRREIPKDYITQMKMAYLERGADPSHEFYGWVMP